jgi:hypothetical protein
MVADLHPHPGDDQDCVRAAGVFMDIERRLILDRDFDRGLASVIDAFLEQSFTVTPVDAGDLHRQGKPGVPLRYALLRATPPEMSTVECRVSVFEIAGSCTLVTVEDPFARQPHLAMLMPRVVGRVSDAIQLLMRSGVLTAA